MLGSHLAFPLDSLLLSCLQALLLDCFAKNAAAAWGAAAARRVAGIQGAVAQRDFAAQDALLYSTLPTLGVLLRGMLPTFRCCRHSGRCCHAAKGIATAAAFSLQENPPPLPPSALPQAPHRPCERKPTHSLCPKARKQTNPRDNPQPRRTKTQPFVYSFSWLRRNALGDDFAFLKICSRESRPRRPARSVLGREKNSLSQLMPLVPSQQERSHKRREKVPDQSVPSSFPKCCI